MTDTSTPYLPVDHDVALARFWKVGHHYVPVAALARQYGVSHETVYFRARRRKLLENIGHKAYIAKDKVKYLGSFKKY
jgi:Zn-dependent peptidase ImmA (M78 family)